MVEYLDPTTSAPVFKTITFFVQMLRPGERTRPLRRSSSLLVAPPGLSGHSIVDKRRRLETVRHACVWQCLRTCNGSDRDPVFLFVASDEPALKAFAPRQAAGISRLAWCASSEPKAGRRRARGPPRFIP